MDTRDLSILIVDDQKSSRSRIRSALSQAGYRDIRLANDADHALRMLDERQAEVLLADWIMPEMDGLELTNHIRQQDEDHNHYTSIIMLTAREGVEHLVAAFEKGVDDYLTKPVDDQELAARVHAAGRIATLQNTLLDTAQVLSANNRHLQELATTDPLTGLGNRRFLQEHMNALLTETKARGGVVSCGLLDIDHFKEINDRHGHDVGDEVLVSIARRLRRTLRPTDIVTRVGGEEFAITMRFADPASCNPAIFERLLQALSARPVRTAAGDVQVSASLGVCCYGDEAGEATPETLLKCADEKLYKAKEKGRDCVVY